MTIQSFTLFLRRSTSERFFRSKSRKPSQIALVHRGVHLDVHLCAEHDAALCFSQSPPRSLNDRAAAHAGAPRGYTSIRTLINSWWLLALCGALDAIYSAMNLLILRPDGSLALRTFVHSRGTLVQMGVPLLAAGACTIAVGLWSSPMGRSWLLMLNGLACSALGLIFTIWTGRLAFRTVALLIVVMAISIGAYELATAQTLRRHLAPGWLLSAAGVVSIAFALAFLAFVFRWIKLDPGSPSQTLRWLGSYFAFAAICMLGLALHFRNRGPFSNAGQQEAFPALGNPKLAH